MALLELRRVGMSYGRLQAVSDLDLTVDQGQIHSLIGPNGAGKTTVFNLIAGFFKPSAGAILFNGEDITGREAHEIAQKGIARSFQQTNLFMTSTVLDNVLIGFHLRNRAGVVSEFLHTQGARRAGKEALDQALEILDFMGLGSQRQELAKNLPHGHQRALGVSIALACNPSLLLMDEPVTGMNPTESNQMVERIYRIRDKGITVLIVEHSMRVVMGISDMITVVSYGKKIAEGKPDEIRSNREVIEAYIGEDTDAS
jgi:branched-chain amino acid transport system ATP-binding protein